MLVVVIAGVDRVNLSGAMLRKLSRGRRVERLLLNPVPAIKLAELVVSKGFVVVVVLVATRAAGSA